MRDVSKSRFSFKNLRRLMAVSLALLPGTSGAGASGASAIDVTGGKFRGVPFGRKNKTVGSRFVRFHLSPPEREFPRQWRGQIATAPGHQSAQGMKKKTSKGPDIRCAHKKLVATGELKANAKNPNKHPEAQLDVYEKVLLHQGWRKAIVVSNRSGLIVTGEGAWRTAVRAGWPVVPVDYQDFESPEQELQHLLADNSLPQLSEIDEQELSAILSQDLAGLDAELAGALVEPAPETKLQPLDVKQPPKMAWALIGIPLVRFSEVNAEIERIAGIEGTIVESTVNDQESLDGKQPRNGKA